MGRADEARYRGTRVPVYLVMFVMVGVFALGAVFGGDAFAKQWKLEDTCDRAAAVAADVESTDPETIQLAVNDFTTKLEGFDGFSARAALAAGDERVNVTCSRRVKPRLSGLFQFKGGIHQTAESSAIRGLK